MKEEKTYQCICGKSFDNGKSLQRHKATCKIWKQYKVQQEEITKQERELRRLPNGLFKCENPDCNNEHDGSYGNGKFCCKACAAHVRSLNSAKSAKKNGHKHAPKNFLPERAEFGKWKCDQCGQIFETRAKLYEHKHEVHHIQSVWNKGLTAETDARVKAGKDALNEGLKSGRIKPSFLGRTLTKQHKDRIVATYEKNRIINKYRGFYKGIYFQYSFELAWLVWNLEHNIKVERCKESFEYYDSQQKKIRRYYPDFVLEDGTIIEIKGRVTQNVLDKQDAMINVFHRKYKLLTKPLIQYCLDYCVEKYGKDFIQVLKNTV